jgi:HD-GYP domain-containing protein (c-di-GMP phosphodiesterase class II)
MVTKLDPKRRSISTPSSTAVLQRVLLYLVLGTAWIVVSDLILVALHLSPALTSAIQVAKGVAFVGVVGLVIYRGLLDLFGRIEAVKEDVVEASIELVARIGMAVEYRDGITGGHNHRIGAYALAVAQELGLPRERCEMLRLAAPLHDLGKIAVPDAVLLKPGPLNDEERELMRRHVEFGVRILADGTHPVIQLAETVARTHHERWNGTGYPEGLRGEWIPLEGRIVAVCDSFDAMISDRPYHVARSIESAIEEICSLAGTAFDPKVVEAFLACEAEIRRIHADSEEWQPRRCWHEILNVR